MEDVKKKRATRRIDRSQDGRISNITGTRVYIEQEVETLYRYVTTAMIGH